MRHAPVTYVAVDLAAIRHNLQQVRARLSPGAMLCAVVKANAYGHGTSEVARCCADSGAQWLAVSSVDEGVALREAGIVLPILVFLPPARDELAALVEHDLTATVTSTAGAMALMREADRQGKTARGHLYEDMGLSRMGPSEPVLEILAATEPWPSLRIEGLYSHFGPPGSGVSVDEVEWMCEGASLKLYASALADSWREITGERPIFHVAASSVFLEHPEHHFHMARIGTLLYGQHPGHIPPAKRDLDLRDTFELRSRIVSVHTVRKGAKIGYGGDFVAPREMRLGTVPVGLTHGLGMTPESVAETPRACAKAFLRRLAAKSGRESLLPRVGIGDKSAALVGRISMDQCCVDLTDLPEVGVESEVVLPVRRTAVPSSVPRVYTDDPAAAPKAPR
ncbi:MAG: alanine racemase [Armatimonadetes bacterium]|nr:alanine racemase [Armatimonadota bacterium]